MFTILDENFGTDDVAVALRKEHTNLKDKIDKTITEMKQDGTYDKWFFSE